MALTSAFTVDTGQEKGIFHARDWGYTEVFQHPDRQMPGQLLRADGSFDSLILQFLVTPVLERPT